MRKRRNLTEMRKVSYYAIALALMIGLTLIVNLAIFLLIAFRCHQELPLYAKGEDIMEELAFTDTGYELSKDMQTKLTEMNQWAMLLDENGNAVWSFRKPEEIKESYSRSDIARMSRWYLEDYPVYLRVWDDKIMLVGIRKHSMWKYNIEFPISWIDYMKKVWFWIVLFDFALILILAFSLAKRWTKNREQARIEWVAGISHDIRTPLSMVMGYSDTLQKSENLTEEERRQMAVIRHQSMVMKELVEDLNLTSRLEYSMQALRVEKVRPAAVLREAAAEFLSDADEEKTEIEIEISEQAEGLWIQADRKLLVRVLRNLFHNSIQHGKQQETTIISLHMRKERGWCCISFSDNGVGYSKEDLHQLQRQKKERPEQKIRGLGIVRKIVFAHGGKIHFDNNERGGCFCEIRLPVK